ncbi:MAG TPA: carboxypeptidase regulatory-like domain-containing protein, partial [Chitinophagaceae bacterium]
MKRIICLLSLFFGYLASASAQGTGRLAGKIINEKNEALAGVTVSVKGTNLATASTVDGSFILSVPAGSYEVTFTALGYASKIITGVEVKATGTTDLDIVLQSTTRELETVEVRSTASARKETVNSAINFQRNTNTVASVVSAEAIRRSPDRTTGDVLRRTPGASLQEGRFLVIRGLADRYNQAMLNGILLTSTEPDRKTFAFDLIPAAVIDNIVINKAFVPEY